VGGRRAGPGGGFARADRAHTRASIRPLQRFCGNRITDDPRIPRRVPATRPNGHADVY